MIHLHKRAAQYFLSFFLVLSTLLGSQQALAQCSGTATAATSGNWNSGAPASRATWTFTGGATSPNDACLIVIPNGITVTINNNQTFIGNVEVYGTLDLANQLNLGSTAGCGLTLKIFGSGLLAGAGASERLIICGTTVVTGQPVTPPGAVDWPADGSFSAGDLGGSGAGFGESGSFANSSYTWVGTTSDWTVSTNWTPSRNTPATADDLTFNASGTIKSITNIPSQTVGKILVTGSATYSFVPATSNNTLTLSSTSGNALQVDNGSTLGIGSPALNLTMPTGGTASIGGQLNLVNGNFGAGGATVVLHTNSTPLARTSGQMSLNSSSVLKFGDTGLTTGGVITLPNSIFVSSPTISSLIVNRTNGATLGDQSITVNSGATFTLGDLNTNAAGRIKFSSSSTNPTESTASKIVGYAEMNLRAVNTGALNFLGLSLAAGADNLGSVTLVRRTGASGINTFNSNQSIASSWDVSSSAEPVSGRNISFSWQSAFDNVTTASNMFQSYVFNSGPGWTAIGALQNLASVGPPRQTVAVGITKLSDTFTVTDASQSLPVELISFTAKAGFESAILEWATSSELNFDYFSVQRSTNGKDFEEIGQVSGHGTTDNRHDYSFVDESVLVQNLYYRLKTVDFDGYTEYSSIAIVDFSGAKAAIVYPNPVEDERLFAKFNFEVTDETRIEITDMVGSRKLSLVLPNSGSDLFIPISIEPGTYILLLKTGDFTSVQRIVVK
ncbi:MAG: T9SS type A sorting domain-containing protein [Cyclobacteriaceae bacterium]